jgi:uncharacterized protein (DUF1330 family)
MLGLGCGTVGRGVMKIRYTVALSMVAGVALGGAAIQALHAQAKPKAYTISEIEPVDATAQGFYAALMAAESAAGGRSLHTAGGRLIALEGAAAPKIVAITEWDSVERRRHFTDRRLGSPLRRSVRRRSRQFGATSSKP